MIKNECRHAYKMLDHAECLWCEDCVEKLVNRMRKPKVSIKIFDEIDVVHYYKDRKRIFKEKLEEAGVEVESK